MTGEGERASRKISNRSDESTTSPGRTLQRHTAVIAGEELLQQQPAFKKPRLDVSLMTGELSLLDSDGNTITLRNNGISTSKVQLPRDLSEANDHDAKMATEGSPASDPITGECSTCGDVGFHTELFRCSKGCTRLQHTYCSNSYNPRKRWFIGLCNWCEAEVAASSRLAGGSGTPKVQVQGSRRDAPWSSTSRGERTNAVECLLGAALRLPSAGFSSVEDLLQVEPHAGSSGMRRKPPSFDSVEKARRSGPSVDNAVKSSKRAASIEISTAAGEIAQRSSSSAVDSIAERLLSRSPPSGDAVLPSAKLRRSPTCSGDVAGIQPSSTPSTRDAKVERRESAQQMEQRNPKEEISVRRTLSSDSSEKFQTCMNITGEAGSVDKARRLSPVKSKDSKSPKGFTAAATRSYNDQKSLECSSFDSAAKMKRSSSSLDAADKSVEPHNSRARISGTTRKESNTKRSPKTGCIREGGDVAIQPPRIVDGVEKLRRVPSYVSVEKPSVRPSPSSDEFSNSENLKNRSPPETSESNAEGGSDCSNITQEKRSGNGKESSAVSPRKRSPNKQLTSSIRQLVRPNYIIGKSPRSSGTDERLSKKIFNHKDANSKLRRTSSKISGFHNYKSLSDILC